MKQDVSTLRSLSTAEYKVLYSAVDKDLRVKMSCFIFLPSGVSVARPIIAFYLRFRDICIYIYMSVCKCIVQDRAHLTQVLSHRPLRIWHTGCCLHLFGYSVNGHISIRVRVRVWYYFIFRDRYMK